MSEYSAGLVGYRINDLTIKLYLASIVGISSLLLACNKIVLEHVVKILDAKYEKANLPEIIANNCSHLSPDKQIKLLWVLTEYEDLFLGTLGDWKTEPVFFELKEGSREVDSPVVS
jgi:hypothetical protein